ncbi:Non-specific serine/threonine protein kinase protein [Dioscorea alata]|uniref:Non-specific serine/threonine protein kinase protein n=1 Tax=Dioscorea alata TaxID=55571 RepID=A0ACB7UKT6_DIOAL|nr:Non-specific serine/threonine protein kinase protein [Dioscorea alata]
MGAFRGFHVLSIFVMVASAQLPSQDILALLEFKKGITSDPKGYITDSWNEESIDFNGCPSSWNGIVCSGGNVAGVVLDNLGLLGVADLSVFGNLSMLFKLSMANNSLSGSLPNNLAEFKSLKFLDISNNMFSGELPVDIGQLKSLQNLSLARNNFTGSLPDSIGMLASILSLDLSYNHLTGSLPLGLKQLRNLVSVNLSFNMLTKKIPEGLDVIPNLETLDLSWNQFDGGVDWNFLMGSSVVHVDLSGNLLTTSSPKELKFLSDISDTLKYLNLSNNRLSGLLIDGSRLSTFGNLKALDLSYNQLSGELPEFEYVYDLEVLRLGNNAFSGFLPNGLLKGDALVLRELDLSANNLSGQMSWITSTTLQILNLSSNAISGDLPLLTGSCIILDLSKNQFDGNLSVIVKWGDEIEYIDVSHNQLTGPIPYLTSQLPSGVQSSTGKSNLKVLKLSGNHFNGSFPDDVGSLTAMQNLDISANNFSGSLPSTISKLRSLGVLDISQNLFSGPLPSTLPNTLISFNASYNDLSGVLPPNLRKFPESSFRPGNARLELPGVLPSSTPSSTNTPANRSNKPIKTYIKVAVIVACVVGVVIIILLAIILHYRMMSRQSRSNDLTDKNGQMTLPDISGGKERVSGSALMVSGDDLIAARKGTSLEMMIPEEKLAAGYSPSKNSRFSWSPDSGEAFASEGLGRLDVRSPDRLAGDLYFLDETITLTPEELSRAPAEVLGRSSHGTSYRATLDNGVLLTVKWLREGVAKQKKEFQREVKKFANIRHPNVVGLRGYYWGPTQHEKLILSDYISPGSLASFLYDRPGRKGPPLTWAQRLKIAVDVARGLNYLHFDRAVPHGNLKATNILLDGLDLNARVADYCLYRLMTQAGTIEQIHDAGVLGYRAPELAASKKPSPSFKSDIYAFGVVLLELLTGRCAGDVVSGEEGGVDLTDWVRLRVAEGRGSECFDSAMASDIANPTASKGMKEMLGIALRCIRPVSERPGIKSVYEDLSSI